MTNLTTTIETPKLTIKEKVSKTIEKEINLPHFCKYSEWHFFKVISKDLVIAVYNGFSGQSITISDLDRYSMTIVDTEKCTEEEFEAVKELVKAKIAAL